MTATSDTPRRLQIEEAASTLFRERGYAATSVRDIAQALNLQGGSLYAHMASKEDVLWSIVMPRGGSVQRGGRAHRADPAFDRRPASQRHDPRHVGVVTSIQKDAAVFLHEWRFLSAQTARPRCRRGATTTKACSARHRRRHWRPAIFAPWSRA